MKEFGINKQNQIILDKRFRDDSKSIKEILDIFEVNEKYSDFDSILKHKSKETEKDIEKLFDLRNSNQLKTELNDILSSLIHMMINRLFKSEQRLQEMVLYYYLFKYYTSAVARGNSSVAKERTAV